MALNPQTLNRQTRRYGTSAFLLCIVCAFVSFALLPFNPYAVFTITGFLAGGLVLLPLTLRRDMNLISCWSLTILSVLLGCVIRGIYIGVEYPDFSTLNYYYFLGKSPEYFVYPSILFLSCLLCLSLGFCVGPGLNRRSSQPKTGYQLNSKRVYFFSIAALIVSVVASVAYVQLTGGFDISNLSSKRTLIESLVVSQEHRTWQSLRITSSITILAHLLVLGLAVHPDTKSRGPMLVLALLLFLSACFIPFYASSRGPVFLYFLFSLAMIYHVNRRIPWGRILIVVIFAILLFETMSKLRRVSDQSVGDVASNIEFNISILDDLVLNRNAIELGKTSHIINAIPGWLDYQYGKTIYVWLVAPIPREMWNSKPMISSGPIIGTQIYGNRISGVPPGLAGELYWNFSVPGMILGAFLVGWLLRWVDWKFKPRPGESLTKAVVFIYGPMSTGYLILGNSIGFGIVNAAVKTVLALAVLKVVRVK